MHFILFISDYHHICYRFLLLRSSLHTPFYKPKSTIHASTQSGIPDTQTHYTGRKNWRSASEQNFYDNHRPGKRYSMKDETKQPEINAGIIFASQGFSVHFAPHKPLVDFITKTLWQAPFLWLAAAASRWSKYCIVILIFWKKCIHHCPISFILNINDTLGYYHYDVLCKY